MNKEKAIKILKDKTEALNKHIKNYEESDCIGSDVYRAIKEEKEALETAIQYIENSIPKEVIENKINDIDKVLDAEYEKSIAYMQLMCARNQIKELLEEK